MRMTLLVVCPDRKGLVATLSQFLYLRGANILEAQQHTDPIGKMFFQRIHFDANDLNVSSQEFERLLSLECEHLNMNWRLSYSDNPKTVAIFVSKYEHCLYDLLIRHRLGELFCRIVLILSNHSDLEFIAKQFRIPYYFFQISQKNKLRIENLELDLLKKEKIDILVLARYMQILTENFVRHYSERIINIHHGFLPAFVGQAPYQQAYQRGVKLIGATAHYVTSKLDEGPIISQNVVECSHRDTIDDLVRKGRDVERMVLSKAVRAHLEDRIIVYQNRCVVF